MIRSTRFRVESEEVARDLANGRIKIKDIISDAIDDRKKNQYLLKGLLGTGYSIRVLIATGQLKCMLIRFCFLRVY